MPDTEVGSVDWNGHAIATEVMGPEGSPPLVLVHGTPFSRAVWRRIAPVLAVRHRVYLFDLLGYGASAMPEGDVSLGAQNRLMAALLSHWGLERPMVLAHDFGGATALRTHLLGGVDYARLMLVDPVAIRPWGSPFVAHVRDHEAAFAGMPAYMHRALIEAYLATASHAGLSAEAMAAYRDPWEGDPGQGAFYRQIAQMDMAYTDEVEPLYAQIRCPVSILWGVEDQWIPIETGRRFAAMIPGARVAEVPGSGHLMQEDAPDAILAEALRFFGEEAA